MSNGKYIIVHDEEGGETPIIFPFWLTHAAVARAIDKRPVVAAGFVHLDEGKVVAYGESTTLSISSRGSIDGALITRMLRQ